MANRECSIRTRLGKSSKLKMLICKAGKGTIPIRACGRSKIDWEETKHWPNVESTFERSWFGRANICVYLGCTQRECQTSKDFVDNYRNMLNPQSLQEIKRCYFIRRNLTRSFLHGPMTWKVMQRNAWAILRTGKQNNSTAKQCWRLVKSFTLKLF